MTGYGRDRERRLTAPGYVLPDIDVVYRDGTGGPRPARTLA